MSEVYVCRRCRQAEIEDENGRETRFIHCYGLGEPCQCPSCHNMKEDFYTFIDIFYLGREPKNLVDWEDL